MKTVFDLEGRFVSTHHRKVTTSRIITLRKDIPLEDINKLGHEGIANQADILALQHSRYVSPFEKTWLEDWQLIPHKVKDEDNVQHSVGTPTQADLKGTSEKSIEA